LTRTSLCKPARGGDIGS